MNIAVYCGANPGNNPAYRTAAKELGTWIGENNHRLIYGGGDVGLMGEVANACLAAGGEAIGFMPQFLIDREIAHDHLTQLITVQTMSERKQKMLDKSDIMDIYNCESNKALKILRLMFQMGYGNKIGKEYYISKESQEEFVKNMTGKQVYI